MERGDVYWVDFDYTGEAEPAFRRPALIVQSDQFNQSAIPSVLVAPLTANTRLSKAPGNILLRKNETGLKKDSVVVVSQIVAIRKTRLLKKVGAIDPAAQLLVDQGIRTVFDL